MQSDAEQNTESFFPKAEMRKIHLFNHFGVEDNHKKVFWAAHDAG